MWRGYSPRHTTDPREGAALRKWLIAVLVVVALGVGGAALVATNLNRFLERNHDWLRAQVETAVGRPVAFDRVRVRLWGGIGARVEGLRVEDDAAWGGGDLLRADLVEVSLRILPALIGRYEVGRVRIERPVVKVVRTPQGLNLATLGPRTAPPVERTPSASGAAAGGALAALLVSRLELHQATVQLTDRTTTPARDLRAERLDVTVSDIGLGRPVHLVVTADVLGDDAGPVRAEGTIGPLRDLSGAGAPVDVTARLGPIDLATLANNPPPGLTLPTGLTTAGTATIDLHATGTVDAPRVQITFDAGPAALAYASVFDKPRGTALGATIDAARVSNGIDLTRMELRLATLTLIASGRIGDPPNGAARVALDGEQLDVAALASVVPPLRGVSPGGTASVHLELDGPLGAAPLPLRGRFTLGGVRGTVAGTPIDGLEATATVAGEVLTLERATLRMFGGTVTSSGHVDAKDHARPRLDATTTIRGLDVSAAAASRSPSLAGRVGGTLDASAAITAAGASADALRASVRGTARASVTQAVLKDVNLIDDVLGKSSGIPGLSTLLPPRIRSKYPALFSTGDTRFDQLEGDFRIGDERVVTENLVASARDFTARARGTIGFDGRTDLDATLHASPQLTTDIVGEVKEARYLVEEDGRLAIPFEVVGTAPALRAQPDITFLTNAIGRGVIDQGIDRLLGNHKKGGDTRPRKDQGDLLRKGLDSLLGH